MTEERGCTWRQLSKKTEKHESERETERLKKKMKRKKDLIYFLSYDLATYLNCFLMLLPSMSLKWKVLVAEVARPRHLVGFQLEGTVHTEFMLGALIFSTVFLTASRRFNKAE